MQVIILGAGQVGGSLAEILLAERHGVTIVDTNEARLKELSDRFDVRTITGPCSYPEVLRLAGADDADMLIAVTDSDEANMVACQVAYSLFQVPKKIARIRSAHYFIRKELFGSDNLPIDVFISPEQLLTDYVVQLILYPGTLQVLYFGGGLIKLVAVKPAFNSTLVGQPVGALNTQHPGLRARVVTIFRNGRAITIKHDTCIKYKDEVFFIAATQDVSKVLSIFSFAQEQPYKKIMIAGGGNIGLCLSKALEKKYQVKLIDHNKGRCEAIASELTNTIVLCGEANDESLLINENIDHTDVFVAVTNDDEANIVASLQAKRLGVKQVMTLMTRTAYIDLIEGAAINIAISPQQITMGSILAHVRQGDIKTVYSLRRGAAEVIEAVAHGDRKTSKVVGRCISDLKISKEATIIAILRGKVALIPDEQTEIESKDHVIILISNKKHLRLIEKLFQVSASFF